MNSFHSNLFYLIQLRQDLEKAEEAFKNHQQLSQKRELIEKKIVDLEHEMDDQFRQFRHKGQEDAYLYFQQAMQEKHQHLKQLKTAQRKLDDLLDQSEDLTEKGLEQQLYQLLLALWSFYPSQRETQEAKWKELHEFRLLAIELEGVKLFLNHLSNQFYIAIQTRQSIKGRGILNYIFGRSPNIVIEQQLLGAHAVIVKMQPLIQKIIKQSPPHSSLHHLFQEIDQWSGRLKTSCQSTWGFRHIDTIFSEAHQTVLSFIDRTEKEADQMQKTIENLNEEIRNWIQTLETYPDIP